MLLVFDPEQQYKKNFYLCITQEATDEELQKVELFYHVSFFLRESDGFQKTKRSIS